MNSSQLVTAVHNRKQEHAAHRGRNGADRFFWAPELVWLFAIKINGYQFLNNRRAKYWHSHSIRKKAGTYSVECCKRFPVVLMLYILCSALVEICSSSQWRVKPIKKIFSFLQNLIISLTSNKFLTSTLKLVYWFNVCFVDASTVRLLSRLCKQLK